MDIQTLEKENGDLKRQNRKRNMVIGGFMVAGAVAGFFVARGFKGKALAMTLGAVGGSFAFGLPVLFATRKKAVERRKKIEQNNLAITELKDLNTSVANIGALLQGKKDQVQTPLTEEQKKTANALLLATANLPGGSKMNLNKLVS
jgi:hypothetical protein